MSEKYTKEHEWVRVSGDIATVGISDYAQRQLGDVVFIELPEIGKRVKKGDEVAVVESVKAASEVYSPIAGEVTEINAGLDDEPAKVNTAPLTEGWLFRVRQANPGDLDGLMNRPAYDAYIEGID